MFKKILVPVDGSAFAETALPLALTLARRSGAKIRLAMVTEPADLPPGIWAESFLENHARYLDAVTTSLAERGGDDVDVSSTLLEGRVANALCEEAASSGADLIAMSTHGQGGLTRMWLGSVTDAVLHDSPVPVVVVRPSEGDEGEPVGPDAVTSIVVPLDGSAFAEAAIGPAFELARLFDASVTLLRAVSYPVMISSYLPDTAEENRVFIRHSEDEARTYLDQVRSSHPVEAITVRLEVLVSPRPASGILDHVAESGANLVVMASHSRRGIARAAIGSIADKVIRGSKTPVLVVHAHGDDPA